MTKIVPKDTDQFDDFVHKDTTTFEELTAFDRNHLAPLSINNRFGLIDKEGHVIIPFDYQKLVLTTLNAYSAQKDNKWGFITKSNQILIPFDYDVTSDYIENVCAVKKDGKWGFIDLLNQAVIPFDYDGCTDFRAGLAGVEKDGKWGMINKENQLIIDYQYEYLTPVDQRFATFGKATSLKVHRPDILAYFPYFLSKDHHLMNFGLISTANEKILEPVSELPILESFDNQPVVRQNYQLGYLKNGTDFIKFDQFTIDPYEEKILKQLGVMK
ncbi:WG repeat-containing protein [Empedobacter brevis]|uniref:WG repeat-containing protein n=1 Tax=Empedobacter brevis TaxID=247 RepID=A0AAJ1QCL4_9FLAO|nr:WG repeat-containing protein [Empedobacter brevis]MDM1071588.1 WG repeat-containing protein [Empedobacter brevis]